MKISGIIPHASFTGEIHPSLKDYIYEQRNILVDEEAKKCKNGYTLANLNRIDKIGRQVDKILTTFSKKAAKMGKNTVIGIENRSKYGSGIRGEYWLCASNKKIPKDIFSREPEGEETDEMELFEEINDVEKWQINSSEKVLSPEETRERITELANAFDPKETDRKLLEEGRNSIENRILLLLDRKSGKKLGKNEVFRMLKYAKAYQQAKKENAGKEKIKEKSLVKWVKEEIKKHNHSIRNIDLEA